MNLRFAVVYEGGADFQIATQLADRVLLESIEWLDERLLDNQREWGGASSAGRRLTWKALKQMAYDSDIRVHGHFGGAPASPDAKAAKRAIDYILKDGPDLAGIVLVRDQDDQPERRIGLEQARTADRSGIPIVVGLAITERECWALCGFEPDEEPENSRLERIRQELGHDPRTRSHQLTACKNDQALRSPKRILRVLCGDDPQRDRERRCWQDTPMETLRDRGTENGLVDYLDEVKLRLAPLIGYVRQDRDSKST